MISLSMRTTVVIAIITIVIALLLSPAFLVHGTRGLYCNLFPFVCSPTVMGRCHNDFELTRKVFEENFAKRGEVGAAVAVYFRGELVVDMWGGDWGQFKKAKLRSTAGINRMIIAMFMEEGILKLEDSITDLLPIRSSQHIKQDITVEHLLTEQFTLEQKTSDNNLRAPSSKTQSVTRWVLRLRNSSETAVAKFGYYPQIVDSILSDIIKNVDPTGRDIPQIFSEKIAPLLQPDIGDGITFNTLGSVPDDTQSLNMLSVLLRLYDNTTDSWAGPFPVRDLWRSVLFEGRVGFTEYVQRTSTPIKEMLDLTEDVPTCEATAKSLARLYSAVACGDPGSKTDMGYKSGHSFYKSRLTTDCIALKHLTGLDDIGRNVSKSSCGFITTSEEESLFGLKEAQTHGRRWMHFAWSNFAGSYAAASVGHGVSVVYLTNREGPYDKDPRVKNILEAVRETVYWKELEEFTAGLKKKGITTVKNYDDLPADAEEVEHQ